MTRSFPVSGPVAVTVDIAVRADIRVLATLEPILELDLVPRRAGNPLDERAVDDAAVTFDGERLTVRYRPLSRFIAFNEGGAVVATLRVPAGSAIDLASGMGDIDAVGEFGDARLASGMGDLRVGPAVCLHATTGLGEILAEAVAGPAELHTGSGRVRAGRIDGPARVRNGNGRTELAAVGGDLRVRAANGDIVVGRAGSGVDAKSSNGTVRLEEVVRGDVAISSAAGALEVGVRAGSAAWLDLRTSFGAVRTELASGPAPTPGDDALRIRARTGYGDVTVRRAGGERTA